MPTSQPSEDARLARRQRIVPREELLIQKNSRSAFERVSVSVRCNNGSVWANCKDGTIRAIVVLSQSGGALHLDLSRGRSLFSLLLCLSNCEQFHILRTYRTSVFPLSLYRNESSIGERTLYKTLLLIRILRKTVRQEQIRDTKSTQNRTSVFTTELNERVHESKQCIPSLFTYIELKVPSGSFFGKSVFTSRTPRTNPVLKSSISNWRFSGQCSRTELNECVYHTVESSVQNTNRICLPQN